MKRADDVFFFTLIDFLIQVFFFGLLLFVVGKAVESRKETQRGHEAKQINELVLAAGVSNITELQDYLTRLAPIRDLQGTADFIRSTGGEDKVREAVRLVADAGGAVELKGKLKKYDDAYGLPPCLRDEVNGKQVPRTLAVLRVEDEHIEIQRSSGDLEKLLGQLGTTSSAVQRLTLEQFRSTFLPLKTLSPQCAYFVEVRVATQYIKPMRAVWSNFRVK